MTRVKHMERRVGQALLAATVLLAAACWAPANEKHISDAALDSMLLDGIRNTNALKFEQAQAELDKLVAIARKKGDSGHLILGTINLGALYLKYNADDEAIKYFLRALDQAREFGRDDMLNTIYNNIGVVYSTNNAHDKAIEYYTKALEISRQQNNQHRMAVNLINLGIEIRKKGNEAEALRNLRQSLAIFRAHGDTVNASATLHEIGDVYYQMKAYDSALTQYHNAYAVGRTVREQYYQPVICLGLGKTYHQLHAYDSAERFLQRSLTGFRKTGNTESIIEAYGWLSSVSQAKGQPAQALRYSNESLAWKDSLLREKTSTWISELQMKYEFGKKEKEIELLQQQAAQQKRIWAASIVVAVVILVLLFVALRSKNINLQQRNIILQKEQEVNRLTLEKNRAAREQLEKDMQATEKLNALEKEAMRQELMFKDRELATKALHLVNKNETFTSIYKLLSEIDTRENSQGKTQIEKAKKIIKGNDSLDQEWETFKLHFEEVHPRFFTKLQEAYPTLSGNDLRLSAYLLIGLNAKEIANIFNISPESVRKKKQRLREKLTLESDEEIHVLLSRFKQS